MCIIMGKSQCGQKFHSTVSFSRRKLKFSHLPFQPRTLTYMTCQNLLRRLLGLLYPIFKSKRKMQRQTTFAIV